MSTKSEEATSLKVGELAERGGLTVRTLHHYDEIGLLTPSRRTAVGHRLYGTEELKRLQQIASLRQLGLSLEEIGACLDRPEYSLEKVLAMQAERIEEQMDRQGRLLGLIGLLRERLRSPGGASVDDLTRTIEVTMSYDEYYTPEQREALRERAASVGQDRIDEVQEEWKQLFAAFGRSMQDGIDPGSPEVRMLARRSAALIEEFTGGDPGVASSLNRMYQAEGGAKVMASQGMEVPEGLWEYMGRARAALESEGA